MSQEKTDGKGGRFLADLAFKLGGIAIIVVGATVFLAGAIVGLSIVGRLGGAGWLLYAVVVGSYALLFGPVLAGAVTLYQRGSARHRAATERRIEGQQAKFGLHGGHLDDGRRAVDEERHVGRPADEDLR